MLLYCSSCCHVAVQANQHLDWDSFRLKLFEWGRTTDTGLSDETQEHNKGTAAAIDRYCFDPGHPVQHIFTSVQHCIHIAPSGMVCCSCVGPYKWLLKCLHHVLHKQSAACLLNFIHHERAHAR